MKINLGSGNKPIDDYINVDIHEFKGVNIVHDLNKQPYPFKTNISEEIICSHVLEHLDEPDKALTEMHRIIKTNGKIKIKVPYFAHSLAYSGWQHKRYFTIASFEQLKNQNELDWWVPRFTHVKTKLNYGKIYKYNPITWICQIITKIYYPIYEATIS